jgi:hypothetical protein
MEADGPHRTPVVFYQTAAGRTVVLDWLKSLTRGQRNAVGQDLVRAQFRWPVGSRFAGRRGTGCGKYAAPAPATP